MSSYQGRPQSTNLRPEEIILETGFLAEHPMRPFVCAFRDWLQSRPSPAAPDTVTLYVQSIAYLLADLAADGFEPSDPAEITGAHIRAWVAAMNRTGTARNTVSIRMRSTRQFFNFAFTPENNGGAGWITAHPFTGVKPPTPVDKVPEPFTDEEIVALLKVCPSGPGASFYDIRDQAILRLWLDTGARRGEIANLTADRINLKHQRVTLAGKMETRKGERTNRIGNKTVIALKRYIETRAKHSRHDEAAFWLGKRGVLGVQGFNKMLRDRAAEAGVTNAFPHKFRHTFADRWLENGGTLEGLLDAGGWESLHSLRPYIRFHAHKRAMAEHEKLSIADQF